MTQDVTDRDEVLNRQADAAWVELTEQAGLDPKLYVQTQSWRKSELGRARIVRLYESDGRAGLYLKLILVPEDAQSFQDQILAQVHAGELLQSHDTCGVPEILAVDLEKRAFLMEEVPGDTVADLLKQGRNPTNMVRRSGKWMAAFHRAGFAEDRVYQPHFMRDHIAHLLQQVESGEKEIADFELFERYAKIVMWKSEQFEGQQTKSSRTHGDMHLRNLMLGNHGRSWGLDFTTERSAPVGHDIARFLVEYVVTQLGATDYVAGHVVPPDVMEVFFKGYDFVKADDPSVQYLLKVRILMDWAGQPADPDKRSAKRQARLDNLRALAQTALS